MAVLTVELPNDIETLKGMVISRDEEIDLLLEQLRLLRADKYGPKNEKMILADMQQGLFDADEVAGDAPQPDGEQEEEQEIKAYKRRRSRKLPDHLERVQEIIDIPDELKACCGGKMICIGKEVTEKLVYKKAECYVLEIIRLMYACAACEGLETDGPTVKVAPLPPQIIARSWATPSLLAHILTARFVDGLPYYRQEAQFKRLGVEISRSNMVNWALTIADKCRPMLPLLHQTVRAGPMVGVDETTIQVLNEPGRSNKTKSYMWVLRGGPPHAPVIYFAYDPSRESPCAQKLLGDYQGYVQTDAWRAYDYLDKQPGVRHLVCWAHARRRFTAVIKARGKKKKGKPCHASRIVALIRELYRLEENARKDALLDEALLALRQTQSLPVLEKIKEILDDLDGKVVPKSLLGKAVSYTLKNWSRLLLYLKEPFLTPDNNLVENAIRPFVIGRKAWLFAGSPVGAEAGALFYTLVATAKANGWSPYAYLNHLLEGLVTAHQDKDYLALLPTVPPPATEG